MPAIAPLTSSGSRDLEKKPRPLPKHVKAMVGYMVRGGPGDEDCLPLSFIAAGRLAGMAPDVARRWLDRPETRAFLRAERAAFRTAICASNELHLQKLRESPNGMVGIKAIAMLEQIDETAQAHSAGQVTAPGLIIVIGGRGDDVKVATAIDVTPTSTPVPDDTA
jgi:hypothetical protein